MENKNTNKLTMLMKYVSKMTKDSLKIKQWKKKLLTKQEVIELMKTSKTQQEWDRNCLIVVQAFEGFPYFWTSEIIYSGLGEQIKKNFWYHYK